MEHHREHLTVVPSLLGLCSSNGNDLERPNRPYPLKSTGGAHNCLLCGDGVGVLDTS